MQKHKKKFPATCLHLYSLNRSKQEDQMMKYKQVIVLKRLNHGTLAHLVSYYTSCTTVDYQWVLCTTGFYCHSGRVLIRLQDSQSGQCKHPEQQTCKSQQLSLLVRNNQMAHPQPIHPLYGPHPCTPRPLLSVKRYINKMLLL